MQWKASFGRFLLYTVSPCQFIWIIVHCNFLCSFSFIQQWLVPGFVIKAKGGSPYPRIHSVGLMLSISPLHQCLPGFFINVLPFRAPPTKTVFSLSPKVCKNSIRVCTVHLLFSSNVREKEMEPSSILPLGGVTIVSEVWVAAQPTKTH